MGGFCGGVQRKQRSGVGRSSRQRCVTARAPQPVPRQGAAPCGEPAAPQRRPPAPVVQVPPFLAVQRANCSPHHISPAATAPAAPAGCSRGCAAPHLRVGRQPLPALRPGILKGQLPEVDAGLVGHGLQPPLLHGLDRLGGQAQLDPPARARHRGSTRVSRLSQPAVPLQAGPAVVQGPRPRKALPAAAATQALVHM